MQKIFQYRKFIGLTVSITVFLLTFPLTPARAVVITTEYILHQNSEQLSDRARVKAFFARADVMAHMQANGINHEEALSRIDFLTDREIASIAGKIDRLPQVAGGYKLDGSIFSIIGLAVYALFMAIAVYFSRTMDKDKKPE